MLQQVLKELESAQGQVNLDDLSRKLGIERSALEGMIGFLVQKGKLRDDFLACAGGRCGASCSGVQSCSLVTKLPRSFSVASDAIESPGTQRQPKKKRPR